jgi:hypothetical protein
MKDHRDLSARIGTTLAVAVLVVLAGLLGVRLLARSEASASAAPIPPASTVPAPHPCDLSKLEVPCWGCLWAQKWPLRYVTDLDTLAPLGTGTANAATWFATFAKPNGSRFAEAEAAQARRVEHGALRIAPNGFDVLPPNDPLLAEAAPWCDQATMRFYPDVFPVQGGHTQLPNNLFMINLARSWIARGHDAVSFEDAMADFRRVIRLGRLLRQDDVVLIDDMLGCAYIQWGAEAIYDRARKEGKTDLALLAAVVAGEAAPQRYLTAARKTEVEVAPYARKTGDGSTILDLPEARFEAIRKMATESPDRRFRNEAVTSLYLISRLAPEPTRAEARVVLEQLARSDDPIVAANARWSLNTPVDETALNSLFEWQFQ